MHSCRRFVCNVCNLPNEVPIEYFCTLDSDGRRMDFDQRPELNSGSVEYVAPAEYMVRLCFSPVVGSFVGRWESQ